MALTIAIDGPVGAGKSVIAKKLAAALGIAYLDTGATYRALALKVLRLGLDPYDANAVEALADRTLVSVRHIHGVQHTFLDDEDISNLIRTPEVSAAASAISMVKGVRKQMVALQQRYAAEMDIVLDGRDIGTRVLPNATYKFFLDAKPEERAKRRFKELVAKGANPDYQTVLSDLLARDKQDCERAVDPLKHAEDAIEIDTTKLLEKEVLQKLIEIVKVGSN